MAIADGRGMEHGQALRATLSGDEQALADRGSRRSHRLAEYLTSRWLLRRHAAAVLDEWPASLAISYPRGAAPQLTTPGVQLGLAHSQGLCLSVVSTQAAVGCDIERLRWRHQPLLRMAEACFAAEETAALRPLDPADQRRDFYRLWTLKEAALKCTGRGLAGGLDSVVFSLRPTLSCQRAPGRGDWCFASATLDVGSMTAALAIASRVPRMSFDVWRFSPLAPDAPPTALKMDWSTAAI